MKTNSSYAGIIPTANFIYVHHRPLLDTPFSFIGFKEKSPAIASSMYAIGVWKVKQDEPKTSLSRQELYNICKPQ